MIRNLLSFPKGKSRTFKYVRGVFSNFDGRIFILFAVLAVTGGIIFFVKYQSYVDCDDVTFYTDASYYEAGKPIIFQNETPNAKSWIWDFGDGTPVRYMRRDWVLHTFDKPGSYTVKLNINGDFCDETQLIQVEPGDDKGPRVPNIIAPKTAYVGDVIQFDCKYPGEIAYLEWYFEGSIRPDATIKNPQYRYMTPGEKKIALVINGEVQYKATEKIIIEPREIIDPNDDIKSYEYEKSPGTYNLPRGEPEKDPLEEALEGVSESPTDREETDKRLARAPDISEEEFERLLIGVANKTKAKEDFKDYFCEDYENIEVIKNEDQLINFAELCQMVKGKRIKVKSLRLVKNDMNCIVNISIDYKVKKFLRLWWVKD